MSTAIDLPKNTSPAVAHKYANLQHRYNTMKANAKEAPARAVSAGLSMAVGGALGYADGRYDKTEVKGVPVAGAVGALAHVVGFMISGKDSEHAHTIGNAALAVHSARVGAEIGRDQKAKAQNQSAGYFGR